MNVKKGLLTLLLSIFLMPLISAYGYIDLQYGMNQVIQWVQDFTSPFFAAILGTGQFDPFFFTKVLLLILLFVIIRYVLEKSSFLGFDEKPGIAVIVSAVISILAIRFIPQTDLVNLILLPYSVLGIALLTILPFLVFFFFVEKSNMNTAGRRIAWAFYAIVFGVLWYDRYEQLSPLGNQIYGWVLVAIIVALIADPKLKEYFGMNEFNQARRRRATERKMKLSKELEDAEAYSAENPNDNGAKEIVKALKKAIRQAVKDESSG